MTPETDVEIVHRCLRGDTAAMRNLVERFQSDVFALCFRILRHSQDAEDVAQEVFVRVFRSLNRWEQSRPLRPWILGIAINRCRTALAKRAKRPAVAEYLNDMPGPTDDDSCQELVTTIRSAVDALREEYREVFVLFHEAGQSYEEISTVVDRPVGTVKTWLHRARAEVLKHLERRGLVPTDRMKADSAPSPYLRG